MCKDYRTFQNILFGLSIMLWQCFPHCSSKTKFSSRQVTRASVCSCFCRPVGPSRSGSDTNVKNILIDHVICQAKRIVLTSIHHRNIRCIVGNVIKSRFQSEMDLSPKVSWGRNKNKISPRESILQP